MKTARLLAMIRLFLLFTLSVILPLAGHSATYTNLVSWTGWGSSSKDIKKSSKAGVEISKLSFIGNDPPLLLTYDCKTHDESGKTVPELDNNQLYIILDSQPGDLFNFCFRTPPALSTGHFPSPPVIKKTVTGQAMTDIQNGRMRRVESAHGSGFRQHEYSVRWRLPAGNQSLVLAIEDNDNGWVIEPECSGIFSESAALKSSSGSNTSDSKKASFVDIFYRNKQTVKHGPDKPDGSSRFSGPPAIPGVSDTADNSEPYISSGDGFGGGDDLDDLFKKKPGNGMAPLYSFELTSEPVSRMILVPVPDAVGQTVKKQIWDTRIVLKIKRGWNEQAIIISQELWNKIRSANPESSSGLFLALSRNPDNPEAVFDHYLSSHLAQPLQTEGYRRYAVQEFILSPKQLRSVTVFPGHVPTGTSHSGGSRQSEKQMANLSETRSANNQFKKDYGRQKRGSPSGRGSGGDDGSGGSPNSGLCQVCNKPALAFNKCKECLDRESSEVEQEPTKEMPPAIRQDRKTPVSATKCADTSAIYVFQWFRTLRLKERQRGNCFHKNDCYNFPQLYNLLTQSFMSDKNTLSKFHSHWVRFLNCSMSIYELISEVGRLAKLQGIEDYVEVTRIVKVLALYRDEFENETSLKEFGNDLLNCLTSYNFIAPDDSDQVFYSGLDRQKEVVLIKFIYQMFKKTGQLLEDEMFPSEFKIISMLNKLARDVYSKYAFGIPAADINDQELLEVVMWGCASQNEYSFITPFNNDVFLENINYQPLHLLALNISADQSLDVEDVKAMFTALALIRSMFGPRLNAVFPEHVSFAKDVTHEQLDLLSTFTLIARVKLVEILNLAKPEEKDEFIRSMFLIFGMLPKDLSHELCTPEPVTLTQDTADEAAHAHYQQSERSTQQSVNLCSTVADQELQNIGFKLGIDWQKFAKNTGVLSDDHLRSINVYNDRFDDKVKAMMEKWKRMKGWITFNDLLDVLAEIERYDLITDVIDRYHL